MDILLLDRGGVYVLDNTIDKDSEEFGAYILKVTWPLKDNATLIIMT